MADQFAEQLTQLRDAYGEDAVTVYDTQGDGTVSAKGHAVEASAAECPELIALVTLVGTCEVTLAPSDLNDTADAEDDEDSQRMMIRDMTENYATSYWFRFRVASESAESEGDPAATVQLDKVEDITLPAASVLSLLDETRTTLATFDNNPVAVVFALEAAQQLAHALHEAEAVRALKDEARLRNAHAAARRKQLQAAVAGQNAADDARWRLLQLGRRCVYFHHIFCTNKRANMANWCHELNCYALCKIGYPGFLVLEGSEGSCTEYVRRLQGLHWKHMEVRGEEFIPVKNDVDGHRRIPPRETGQQQPQQRLELDGVPCHAENWPRYVETTSAAEMGQWCRGCGLEELFRTGMRIYRSL